MIIKQEPEHFFVREISNFSLKDSGEYAYVLLKKRNYTTDRAISAISRNLKVSKKRIGYAGNKDKRALTEQTISIWKVKKEDIEKIRLKDIELEFLGYSDKRICLGDLKGNFFKISVFAEKNELVLAELKKQARLLSKIGIPNYFGEQRFGSAGSNHLAGKYFLKGDFESALHEILVKDIKTEEGKKASEFIDKNWKNWKQCINHVPKYQSLEKAILNHLINVPNDFAGAFRVLSKNLRRIFIHAYQSYIWNLSLSAELEKLKHFKINIANQLLAVPLESFESKNLSIIGYDTKLDDSLFSRTSLKLLKHDKLTVDDFKLPRMPELAAAGDKRVSKVFPKQLKIEKKKDAFQVSFSLDKGAYATVVLKALFSKN